MCHLRRYCFQTCSLVISASLNINILIFAIRAYMQEERTVISGLRKCLDVLQCDSLLSYDKRQYSVRWTKGNVIGLVSWERIHIRTEATGVGKHGPAH